MSIVIETTQGRGKTEERLPLGDQEIDTAIAMLDGKLTTVLTITTLDNILFIGGGAGKYTVTALMNDGSSYELVGDSESTDDIPMIVGGQRVPQPIRYIVNLDRARTTAKHFAKTGRLDENETWEP
jgi:Immunity protein Imm1